MVPDNYLCAERKAKQEEDGTDEQSKECPVAAQNDKLVHKSRHYRFHADELAYTNINSVSTQVRNVYDDDDDDDDDDDESVLYLCWQRFNAILLRDSLPSTDCAD